MAHGTSYRMSELLGQHCIFVGKFLVGIAKEHSRRKIHPPILIRQICRYFTLSNLIIENVSIIVMKVSYVRYY